jgi:hypothetical protein
MIYSGYSMELYINGELDAFLPDAGLMAIATDDITMGRETTSIQSYSLFGTLDEVRIYDKALGPNEIATLKTLWNSVTAVENNAHAKITVYPNPSNGELFVKGIDQPVLNVFVIDITGRYSNTAYSMDESGVLHVNYPATSRGILILKIQTTGDVIYRKILN